MDRMPSVDALAREITGVELPQPLLVDAAREAIAAGDPDSARRRAQEIAGALLRPVVNATGVLLHTNLGRAPLSAAARHAVTQRRGGDSGEAVARSTGPTHIRENVSIRYLKLPEPVVVGGFLCPGA